MRTAVRAIVLLPVWFLTLVWIGLTGYDPFEGDKPPSLLNWTSSGTSLALQFGIVLWVSTIFALIALWKTYTLA